MHDVPWMLSYSGYSMYLETHRISLSCFHFHVGMDNISCEPLGNSWLHIERSLNGVKDDIA